MTTERTCDRCPRPVYGEDTRCSSCEIERLNARFYELRERQTEKGRAAA